MVFLSLAGWLSAAICLFVALKDLRRKRLVDDLPTSKTHGTFIGQCELKGTAESEKPFTSYLAEKHCVRYKWTVQEHWSRTTVHMTNNGLQTRHESGWEEVARGGKSAPFYLQDDTGVIRIVPRGADIHHAVLFEKECTRKSSLYYDKGPTKAISNSTHRRRFREEAIPLHAKLYVTGYARECADIVAPEIAQNKKAPLFIISVRTEKQIASGYIRGFWLLLILGLLFVTGLGFLYNANQAANQIYFSVNVRIFVFTIGGYLLAFCLGWLWMVYNSMVRLHNRVRQGWSQIEVQLKRRNDLIPCLVECVAGYKSHERGLQAAVAELRAQSQAGSGLAQAVNATLVALSERYPELKANELFLKLHGELTSTEQRLALARAYFNDIATFYNTRLEIIPDRFVATLAGFRRRTLWQADDFERAPVEVRLAE